MIMPRPSWGRTFLFGESECVQRRDTVQFLKDIISTRSPAGAPSKVVLVGQHICAELNIMEKIGIDLRAQKLSSIEGILDTVTISRYIGLPFSQRPSLDKLLEFLRIPVQKRSLHNSGNNAHFTLRALLMLASIGFQELELDNLSRTRIRDLRSIALEPIDFESKTPDQERKVVENKLKANTEALWESKPDSRVGIVNDWLDGSDEESLEMTILGMDMDM
jgi:hypothetical protein